ncbi:hypothetical protein OG604_34055 [Streptomyces sp. NBC_01231]|nr:hypothetical protein OG604_34055 [Streptomyces sp. NBC_01231]
MSDESPKIAVLGSTPWLRSALAATHSNVTLCVLDISSEMYRVTSRLLPADLIETESYHEVNWLDWQKWPDASFTAVVGDKSLDNIPFDAWCDFFDAIRRKVTVGGGLVLHVGLPDPTLRGLPFAQLRDRWLERLSDGSADVDEAACGLWEDLLSASARDDTRVLSLAPFARHLEEASQPSHGDPVSTKLMQIFANSLTAEWTNFSVADIAHAASPWFTVTSTVHSADYAAAANQPLICLTRLDTPEG